MKPELMKAFEFYKAHQAELVEKYGGRFVVIKNGTVLGAYGSELEALEETRKVHALGTFLIQKCEAGPDAFTQTFHSRVSFA